MAAHCTVPYGRAHDDHQLVEVSVAVEVDLRNSELTQELRRVQLRPAILESSLRFAAAGLAQDEQLASQTNLLSAPAAAPGDSNSSAAAALAHGLKSRLQSAAAAYERSGGLWGTVIKLTGASSSSPSSLSSPSSWSSSAAKPPPPENHDGQAAAAVPVPALPGAATPASAAAPAPTTNSRADFQALFDRVSASAGPEAARPAAGNGGAGHPPTSSNNNFEDQFDF